MEAGKGGMMEYTQTKSSRKAHLFFSTVMFLLLLSACGSGGDATDDSSSASGSISFNLVLQNSSDQNMILRSPGGDICADYLIDSIDATVLDASDTIIASGDWPCSAHQGTLSNVPPGSDLTLTIDGIVIDTADWTNQWGGISVAAGQDTNLGPVELNYRGADETKPTILSHFPESDATDIFLNSSIIISFSEDVIPASVQTALSLSGTAAVEGDITYDPSTYRATFTPATPLDSDTQYTIEIVADIQDRAGLQMVGPYTSSFTTGQADDVEPPAAPILLDATAVSDSQIDLSWEAASDNVGVAKYQIFRDGSFVKSVSTTWATDTNLSPSTNYCYTIIAVDAANNPSDPSNEICARSGSAPPPPTPSLKNPAKGAELENGCYDQSDIIEWDFDWYNAAGATQYRIKVSRTGDSDPFIDIVVFSSSYRYSSNEHIPNTKRFGWKWKVRAGNDAGAWSEWSPERSFTVEPVGADCANGLVAYYPFNGNADDESGNELNGTVNGATLTTDRFNSQNSAYMFNGNNNDITVPHDALLNISDQISVIAWIYPVSQKTQVIVRKSANINPSAPYGLSLSATGDIIFSASPNGPLSQVRLSGYSLNSWSFVAGTYDGNAMKLYVDGKLVRSTAITGALNINSGPLLIGTRLNLPADTFHGKLDGIRIYNRALTDNEIASLYEAP
jgi:hypothetical protein